MGWFNHQLEDSNIDCLAAERETELPPEGFDATVGYLMMNDDL